jgi:hypothetical protein
MALLPRQARRDRRRCRPSTFRRPASSSTRTMRVDNPFKEDTWLRAIAVKPGDRTVLHHVTSNHVAGPWQTAAPKIPGGSVGSYTPGAEAAGHRQGRRRSGSGRRQAELLDALHDDRQSRDGPDADRLLHAESPAEIHQALDRHLRLRRCRFRPAKPVTRKSPTSTARPTRMSTRSTRTPTTAATTVELKAEDGRRQGSHALSLPKYDFNWQRDYDPWSRS